MCFTIEKFVSLVVVTSGILIYGNYTVNQPGYQKIVEAKANCDEIIFANDNKSQKTYQV